MALILDTGPLVALLDATDPDHERCAALMVESREQRLVPVPVLVEVEYLVRPWPGAFSRLMTDVASGAIQISQLDQRTVVRAGALVDTYGDLPLGFVDATVLALAERLGEPKVATLDHRHFSIVRLDHVEALELVP